MRRGYRCIFIAAVGWLALAGAQKPAEDHRSDASIIQSTKAERSAPLYAPYANRFSETCYSARNHAAADLCAQWRAAIAAEKAAQEARRATTWSIIATILGFTTVVGLIVTIWQTFRALGEARRGNLIAQKANARSTRQAIVNANDTKAVIAAAERQADIAADTGERQLRAYIAVQLVEFGVDPDDPNKVRVIMAFQNVGETPAIDVEAVLYVTAAEGNFVEGPKPMPEIFYEGGMVALGKGSSRNLSHCVNLMGLPASMVLAGDFCVTAYGRIRYLDVFTKPHETLYCIYVDPAVRSLGLSNADAKIGNRMI